MDIPQRIDALLKGGSCCSDCFGLIIISLFNFFWIICLLFFFGRLSIVLFYLQSFDPQYSFISSNFLSLDMCMCFDSFFWELAHLEEELSLYRPSKPFRPFWQWMPMGEKFQGFEGNWASCFVFVLKHIWLSIYIYSGNSTNNIGWQYMQ
jgi:hypothetical protein